MKTKAISLIIAFTLLFGLLSQAQKLSYGLSGGIDYIGIHSTEKFESLSGEDIFDPMLTFNINGYFAYKSKGLIGISIEPGYMRKGMITNQKGVWITEDPVKLIYNYIQLPILADFYISDHFYISAGFEFDYLFELKAVAGNMTENYELPDQRFQLSGMAGINYEIMKNLDIALRYSHELPYYRSHDYIFSNYVQFLIRFKMNKPLTDKSAE